MSFKSPPEIARAGADTGIKKAGTSWDKLLVAGFLAGAYIAFAGVLAIAAPAGLDPEAWGGVQTLITGAVFTLGLVLVVIAGSELLTGNMALLPLGFLARRITFRQLLHNWVFVLIGNLAGSLFVAYVLAVKTGVVTAPVDLARLTGVATAKGVTRPTSRSSCARSGATGSCASPSGWRWRPMTSAARSSPSSSRSRPSSRWASTTSWPTCSSCRPRSSPTCRASTGATR